MSNKRLAHWSLLGALIVTLVTALLTTTLFTNAFRTGNDWFHDLLTLESSKPFSPPAVSVIYTPSILAPGLTEEDWRRLIDRLVQSGAQQLVVIDPRFQLSAAPSLPTLVYAGAFGANTAPLTRLSRERGVYRQYSLYVDSNEQRHYGLIATAASASLNPNWNAKVGVNFSQGTSYLPVIDSHEILNNNFFEAVIRDQVVVIGPGLLNDEQGLTTPLHLSGQGQSATHFRALALDTLLKQQPVMPAAKGWMVATFLVLSLITLVVFQFFTLGRALVGSALLFLLLTAAGYLSLRYGQRLLPLVELYLVHVFTAVAVLYVRQQRETAYLSWFVRQVSFQLDSRDVESDFLQQHSPWNELLYLVQQSVVAERMVLLEKRDSHQVLQVVAQLNSVESDIKEQRRDISRAPYSEAIDARQPVRLRHAFLPASDHTAQYMIPLIHFDKVVGFWVVVMRQDNINEPVNEQDSLNMLQGYAEQVAELVHQHRQWHEQKEQGQYWLAKVLSIRVDNPLFRQTARVIRALYNKQQILDKAFSDQPQATAVFDLFGRLMHASKQMQTLASQQQWPLYDFSGFELLKATTGLPNSEASAALHRVVYNKEVYRRHIRFANREGEFLLTVHAICCDEQQESFRGTIRPFSLFGIVFDVMNISFAKEVSEMKSRLIEQFAVRVRNDLDAIAMSSDLLADPDLPQSYRQQVGGVQQEKWQDALEAVRLLEEKDRVADNLQEGTIFPVDIRRMMLDSYEAVYRESKNQHDVGVKWQLPTYMHLVLAERVELDRLMRAIFRLLYEDSIEGEVLNISAFEELRNETLYCCVQLTNSGYGMTDTQLTAAQLDPEEGGNLYVIHHFSDVVRGWQGRLSLTSILGQGFKVTLECKCFQYKSRLTEF